MKHTQNPTTSCLSLGPHHFLLDFSEASKWVSLIHPLLPSGTFSHSNQSNSVRKWRSDHVTPVMKIFQVGSHLVHLHNEVLTVVYVMCVALSPPQVPGLH